MNEELLVRAHLAVHVARQPTRMGEVKDYAVVRCVLAQGFGLRRMTRSRGEAGGIDSIENGLGGGGKFGDVRCGARILREDCR